MNLQAKNTHTRTKPKQRKNHSKSTKKNPMWLRECKSSNQ